MVHDDDVDDTEEEEPAPERVEKKEEVKIVPEKAEKPKVVGKIDLENISGAKK